jgi:hypothetical protein
MTFMPTKTKFQRLFLAPKANMLKALRRAKSLLMALARMLHALRRAKSSPAVMIYPTVVYSATLCAVVVACCSTCCADTARGRLGNALAAEYENGKKLDDDKDENCTEGILVDNTLLSDAIAEYNSEYSNSYDYSRYFCLHGIVNVGDNFVVWINGKEVSISKTCFSQQSDAVNDKTMSVENFNVGTKVVEILFVAPHFLKIRCDGNNATVFVGKAYDVVTHSVTRSYHS